MLLLELYDDDYDHVPTKPELKKLVYFGHDKFDRQITQHVLALVDFFFNKGFKADWGRTRITFLDPSRNMVYKIPRNHEGITSNYNEERAFRQFVQDSTVIPVARCKTFTPDPQIGVPVLAMELVEPASLKGGKGAEKHPEWVNWVDGQQVGHNRAGNLVAYDMG